MKKIKFRRNFSRKTIELECWHFFSYIKTKKAPTYGECLKFIINIDVNDSIVIAKWCESGVKSWKHVGEKRYFASMCGNMSQWITPFCTANKFLCSEITLYNLKSNFCEILCSRKNICVGIISTISNPGHAVALYSRIKGRRNVWLFFLRRNQLN